jgi:hypothetical protein
LRPDHRATGNNPIFGLLPNWGLTDRNDGKGLSTGG